MTAHMKNFRGLLLGAALLVGLFAVPALQAQQGRGGNPEERAQARVTQLTEALKLTPAQVAQVKPIVTRQFADQAAAFAQGQGGDMAARRAAMQKQREEVNAKITALLTAEQKVAYQKLVAEEGARRPVRMQRQ